VRELLHVVAQSARAELAASEDTIRAAEARIQEVEGQLGRMRQQSAAAQSRLDTLLELKASFEGVSEGVKMLLAERASLPGLVGVVADVIEVPQQHLDFARGLLKDHGVPLVEGEEDIDGVIHISDMSWSKRIKHPSEVLKKGDVVDAMVLNIDAENQRLSLGLKQLATDIWDDFFSRHQVGSTIEGKVVRMTNFGAFVELDEGIEGLIHVSEFDDSRHAAKDEEKIELKVGETYQMKIIKLSPEERKIGLSIRALKSDEFRADWESYQESAGDGSATLGDHFRNNR